MTTRSVKIWHHGLVARWWAEFNEGGDDIEYFRRAIERSGEPALDAGCGTGRLLLPFLRHGLDVDGSDAAPDMLAWCRKKMESEGLTTRLYPQPMHELDLPRRYRTVLSCGAFGLGGTRADDLEGLRRIRTHLEPGGQLIMDHHLLSPKAGETKAAQEAAEPRSANPIQDWPAQGDRRRTSDGSELDMRIRLRSFDPQTRVATREICVRQFTESKEVAKETYAIDINLYSTKKIASLLKSAGFSEVRMTGALESRSPQPGDDLIVFHATP